MGQKCQIASDSSPLRGRCREILQTQQGMAEVEKSHWGLVLRALTCVSSRARSASHASSYLMPRHPWMISTWLRGETGLSYYYNCPPPPHVLPFFIKSLFLITFNKKYLLTPLLRVRFTQTTAWWRHGTMCAGAQKQGMTTRRAAVESPLWLRSRIKATGLLCHRKLHSTSPAGNTPD